MQKGASGYSLYRDHDDEAAIAEEAVQRARSELVDDPNFAFVFFSPDADVGALAEEIDDRLECSWVGCSTAGELSRRNGKIENGCVVLALADDDVSCETSVVRSCRTDPQQRAKEATAYFDDYDLLLPLTPGFTEEKPGVEFQLLQGIVKEAGPDVPVVGAAAGDYHRYQATYQVRDGEVYEDALVLTAVSTSKTFDIGLDHGYQPTDTAFVATVDGQKVKKLNGRPAADVYADAVGVDPEELQGTVTTPTGGEMPALLAKFAHQHPFGVRVGDRYVLKVPEAVGPDGEIVFSTGIPDHADLHLMHDSEQQLTESARQSIADWIEADRDIAFGLVFECAGRLLALQESELKELKALEDNIDGAYAGFFGYGEIGGFKRNMCTSNFLSISSVIFYDD